MTTLEIISCGIALFALLFVIAMWFLPCDKHQRKLDNYMQHLNEKERLEALCTLHKYHFLLKEAYKFKTKKEIASKRRKIAKLEMKKRKIETKIMKEENLWTTLQSQETWSKNQ